MRSPGMLVLVLALSVGICAPARAQMRERATLQYDARGRDCPDEDELRDLVAARLGYDPFVPDATRRISLEIRVAREEHRGGLTIEVEGSPPGARSFASTDCRSVAEAAATAIALVLDPEGRARGETAEVESPETASADSAPPPRFIVIEAPERPPPPPSPPPAPPPRPVHLLIGGFLRGSLALAPGPILGGDVAIGVSWDALRVFVEGHLESTPGAVRAGDHAVDYLEATAGIAPCVALEVWMGCAVVDVGVVQATARNVSEPHAVELVVADLRLRNGVRFRVGPVDLQIDADLIVPLVHVTLADSTHDLWTSPPVAGSLRLGAMVEIL